MAEEQEHMPIISLVARDVELKLSTDMAHIDPSTQADNKLPSPISAEQNNESPSPISAEQRNLLPSPIIAELNNFHEYHESSDESLAESTNSETGDPNISITSETSTLSYSLCNDDSIYLSVGATRDRAAATQLLIADSPPDPRGRKRKVSSAAATGSISDSVSGLGSGLYVVEPVPKGLKPSPDTESLKQIKASADKYIKGCSYPGVREFYRDELDTYFNYIKLLDKGIMRKYMKDKRGDQNCPINGKLEGLFFMCSPPDDNSSPKSPFGTKRLILPSSKLLNADTNLYFSDFFCLTRSQTHYISLVITTCDSLSDSFCQQNLIELDKYNNPYLAMTEERKGVYNTDLVFVAKKKQLWVEIFYTEDVDISDVPLMVGVKNSGPRFGSTGIFPIISSTPKRKDCLYNYPTNFRGYKPGLNKIRALAYKYVKGCSYTKVTEFYRNKHHNYFNDIRQRHGGKMKKYVRDDGGDPDCPINGKLAGMFFMCSPEDSSAPKSPFGSKRLILPTSRLLNADTNLYFSNFFCVGNPNIHYISLVVTTAGSKADTFSQKNLLQLDKSDNPYLKFVLLVDETVINYVNVAEKRHLLVEIFYTKDVDISDVPWKVGVRESGPRYVNCKNKKSNGKFATVTGIPKRKKCRYCNPK